MRVTACLSVSLAALALGACGQKEAPATPEPPMAQVSKPEPAKPESPPTPADPDEDRKLPSEADRRAPIDRTATIQTALGDIEKGDFGAAFRYLDKDVDWTEVGLPDGELDSVDEVVAFQKKARTGFSDIRIKPKRIIESNDYQVVEFVWSGKHSGAFADGTAATDKVATIPGAMLLHYKEDGLVDKVWVFQDWPNALQQLGLAPELPVDFKASEIPQKTEVVIGPYEPGYRERYVGFVSALGPEQYKQTLAERATPDFLWWDFSTGRAVTVHDGSNTYFAQRSGRFVRESTEIETAIGAGPYFAAFVENKLVYKGGFMNVPADDQKITTHTLDIVEMDPGSMRFKTLASYGNSYEILAALGVTAGATTKPEAMLREVAIEACDDYIEDMRECSASLDATAMDATRIALDQQIVRWRKDHADGVSRDDIKRACEAAAVGAKQSYGASCPRVDWD